MRTSARSPQAAACARVALVLFCGAALASGCTHRVEPRRSPFMTPPSDGERPEITLPDGSSSGATGSVDESEALKTLREMQQAGGGLVRPLGDGDGTSVAVDDARRLVAANPRNFGAQLALARAYHHEGILDLALEHYLAARELSPDDPVLARDLGRLWVEAGSPELALPYLDAALAADSADAEAWSYRGIGLDLLGRYPEGEAALRRSIAADPLRWDFFNNLGYNLLLQERYEQAAAAFESGLVLSPGHAVLQNNLGLALGLAGRQDDALAAFRRGGSEAEAWNNVGVVHRARGDLAAALEAFDRAHRLDPASRSISRNVREMRMRIALAAQPDAASRDSSATLAAARRPENVVATPVSVGGRRDTAPGAETEPAGGAGSLPRTPAASTPAPRVVPILPVDIAAAPPADAVPSLPPIAVRPPAAARAPQPTPTSGGSAEDVPGQPADDVPTRGSAESAGYRLELLRTGFPDVALKAAAEFRRRTGRAARVQQSGSTWIVQIGRDLALAEVRALRDAALRAGYVDARIRDGYGREVAPSQAPPASHVQP